MEEIHFTITVDHQEMHVRARPGYIARYLAHFEFTSPFEPRRRIPVSETGYRSHFVYAELLEGRDLEAVALEIAEAIAAEQQPVAAPIHGNAQGSLF